MNDLISNWFYSCPFLQNQVSFGNAIAAWEDVANTKQRVDEKRVYSRENLSVKDGPLIVETHSLIFSDDEAHEASRLPSHDAHLLKNTTNLKAFSTALHMARSHQAVGAEVVVPAGQEPVSPSEVSLDQFQVAIRHHLRALQLIHGTRRLRVAATMLSLGRNKSAAFFAEAARKVIITNRAAKMVIASNGVIPRATQGRDLNVVSYDHCKSVAL